MPRRGEPPFLFFLFGLIASVALFFLSALLAPKPNLEDARPKGLGDFQFPTATEGRAIPVVWGSAEVKGSNTIWYGALFIWPIMETVPTGLFSEKTITVGHIYHVGFDLAICMGPINFISRIEVGDKPFVVDAAISAAGNPNGATFTIDDEWAWGGFKKGGGLRGQYQIFDGVSDQNPDAWMVTRVNQSPGWGVGQPPGTNLSLPGYNSLCHFVWRGGTIGETTQIRQFDFTVHRYPNPLGLGGGTHIIRPDGFNRGDANPMNVLYEILTNSDFGLDIPSTDIAVSEFTAAAATLYTEGNGFSMTLDSAKKARDVISEIERQVSGVLFQTSDGKIHFKLVRADYTPASLPVFDETNIVEVKSFTRAAWVETQNSILVKYVDRTDGFKETGAIAQDMANIQIQGREVKAQVNYPGVRHPSTAADIASRDLKQLSFPLARVTMICNREAADFVPGDVFKWSWSAYGISEMIVRVSEVGLGSLANGTVRIVAYQDIFALGTTVYTGGGASLSVGTNADAIPIVTQRIEGVPYWFLLTDTSIDETVVGQRTLHMAEAPNGVSTAFDAYLDISGGGDFQLIGKGPSMTPTGELVALYSETAGAGGVTDNVGFEIDNVVWGQQPSDVTPDSIQDFGYGLIMVDNEIMAFENITDNGNGTYDITGIHRALLDTVAAEHAANARVWFFRLGNAVSSVDLTGSSLTFRHITQTVGDTLPIGSASNVAHTLGNRQGRPLRPGYVRINNILYPTDLTTQDLTTTWRRRGKNQTLVVDDDAADETTSLPGFYILEFRKRSALGVLGSVFRTEVLAGSVNSFLYPRATYLSHSGGFATDERMHVTVFARDTGPVDSFSKWVKEFDVDPGGAIDNSTLSIRLNNGTASTLQQRVQGPAFTTIWPSNPTRVGLAFWFKAHVTLNNFDTIIGGSSDWNAWTDGFGMYATGPTTWNMWFNNFTTGPRVHGDDNLFNGSWHHVVATWDTVTNQTPIVWIDGVAITPNSSGSGSTAITRGTARFELGRLGTVNQATTSYENMSFDDVALYDRVMTQSDVDAIYNGGFTADLNAAGPTANLLLWWKCGEGTGDNATAGTGLINDEGLNGNGFDGVPQAASGNPAFTSDVP